MERPSSSCLLAGLAFGCLFAGALRAGPFEAGLLAHEFNLTLETGHGAEYAGPFFSTEEASESSKWVLAPFMADVREPGIEHHRFEFLYPLLTYDRFGQETRGQVLQLFNFGHSTTQDNEVRSQAEVWPLIFWRRSANPTNSYWAFFPFYGRVQNHLFRDEVRVTLAPFYVWSRKGEMQTWNFLFPFIHVRHGGGVEGWQFLPFAAHEKKTPGSFTNVADDVEIIPGYDKWSFWWPMFGSEENNLGTTNVEHVRYAWPFFTLQRSPARDNTTVLWPFISRTEDRTRGFVEWGAPYPFIGWSRGPGKHGDRYFPFYGKVEGGDSVSDFVMWPAYTHRRLHNAQIDRERVSSLFYLYDDLRLANPGTGDERRRISAWPLFLWRREFDGRTRLQVLAPVEAILPENKGIQRSWSPLWSLYREEANPKTGRRSNSLLWNLWRRDVSPGERRSSALFGLVRTRQTASGRHWRFFWTPFPEEKPAAPPQPSGAAAGNPRGR